MASEATVIGLSSVRPEHFPHNSRNHNDDDDDEDTNFRT